MTQLSIDEKTYTEISPLSAITDGGPIEFFIPETGGTGVCFLYKHYDIEYLALCQDGRQVPAKAFQPDFNNGVSVREFYNMFLATETSQRFTPEYQP
ncbi:hypothetical protein D4764_05G0010610 [Takifugu flavidus]|uniref:Uncharacterized protein n=1 Tax=Takifugu flavidus TaxID=433684 RepID=A0A5C6N3N8_9TELE|nr:hypothetical protein D4764_05G0010610 [Takifugu flavidus]